MNGKLKHPNLLLQNNVKSSTCTTETQIATQINSFIVSIFTQFLSLKTSKMQMLCQMVIVCCLYTGNSIAEKQNSKQIISHFKFDFALFLAKHFHLNHSNS